MNTLGIDPGLSGALCLLDADAKILTLLDMPTLRITKTRKQLDTVEIVRLLGNWRVLWGDMRCVMEEQQAMPNQSAQSGFKTGRGFGRLEGILAARQIPFEVVLAKQWQKAMLGHVEKGTSKDRAKAKAQELYPLADLGRRKSQDRPDAVLIALYGWEKWRQER